MPQNPVDRWLPRCTIATHARRQLETVPGLAASILRAAHWAAAERTRTVVWLGGEIVWTAPWPPHADPRAATRPAAAPEATEGNVPSPDPDPTLYGRYSDQGGTP